MKRRCFPSRSGLVNFMENFSDDELRVPSIGEASSQTSLSKEYLTEVILSTGKLILPSKEGSTTLIRRLGGMFIEKAERLPKDRRSDTTSLFAEPSSAIILML